MSQAAQDLLKSGDLAAALAALQDAVRADPANSKLRIFLFQLLCVTGDWTRAVAQLKLSAEMEAAAIPMAQAYREAIICEVFRDKVFAAEKAPTIFGEPPDWAALLVQALGASAEAATALRNEAFEAAPALRGQINGAAFEWIADADMRLGPLLEIIINGRYFWMPFGAISKLQCEAPSDLRDAVWMPAQLTLANGGDVVALIPTRYAGTVAEGGASEILSRATRFEEMAPDAWRGVGQRLLTTDQGDVPLMDLRELVMEPANG